MNTTPQSNRIHVCIAGDVNAGKSALFNALIESDAAIVADTAGTTTDTNVKSMELLPFGPIVLMDTAGLGDASALGGQRMQSADKALRRADFVLLAVEPGTFDKAKHDNSVARLGRPSMTVFTQADRYDAGTIAALLRDVPGSMAVSVFDEESMQRLRSELAARLSADTSSDRGLLDGLASAGDTVVMVVPLDGEAPKGRLILPQVQLIRACLDIGARCIVVTPEQLSSVLEDIRVHLVITDSQIFQPVSTMVPADMPLTSFSILMARQKADIAVFVAGIRHIERLQDGDHVLIAEVCTHTKNHEDIGRVKIPAALRKLTGKALQFDFVSGPEMPASLDRFSLIVHCGGCMATARAVSQRLAAAEKEHVPMTNYGLLLAQAAGILERSLSVLAL